MNDPLHNVAGDRWFNVGLQMDKRISKGTNIITAEMTFNCHRGHALIYDSTFHPSEEIKLEQSKGKK